jgi:hypothetical protein
VNRRSTLLFALLPGPALASDPTGLFVLFISLPAVVAAVGLLPVCYWAPKLGVALTGLLLAAHIPLMWWAKDVGYMNSAGGWVYTSLSLTGLGLMLALARILAPKGRQAP